jgi:excisionase family DNA binding protein
MQIITLNEAASFLGFSAGYLRKIMKKERIPHLQVRRGGKIQFVREDLEDWVNRNKKPNLNLKIRKLKEITWQQ